LSDGS
jgi:hypothetical protein